MFGWPLNVQNCSLQSTKSLTLKDKRDDTSLDFDHSAHLYFATFHFISKQIRQGNCMQSWNEERWFLKGHTNCLNCLNNEGTVIYLSGCANISKWELKVSSESYWLLCCSLFRVIVRDSSKTITCILKYSGRQKFWPPCMYGMFGISPQIFNNIQFWGLWWPFQSLYQSFLEVLHGWFRGRPWIIVLLEYLPSLQLQCLDWPLNISLYNFLIFLEFSFFLPLAQYFLSPQLPHNPKV